MNSVINRHFKSDLVENDNSKNDGFSRCKIAEKDQRIKKGLFVKVNMDGMPIGRKIDLLSHSTYEGLVATLEEMFQKPNSVDRSIS